MIEKEGKNIKEISKNNIDNLSLSQAQELWDSMSHRRYDTRTVSKALKIFVNLAQTSPEGYVVLSLSMEELFHKTGECINKRKIDIQIIKILLNQEAKLPDQQRSKSKWFTEKLNEILNDE